MPFQTAQALSPEGNKLFPAFWGHTGPKSWEAGLLRAPHLWFASWEGAFLSPSPQTPVRGLCIGEQLTRWQSRPHQWPAAQGLLLSPEKGPQLRAQQALGRGSLPVFPWAGGGPSLSPPGFRQSQSHRDLTSFSPKASEVPPTMSPQKAPHYPPLTFKSQAQRAEFRLSVWHIISWIPKRPTLVFMYVCIYVCVYCLLFP